MTWQWAAVIVIEALAVAFLIYKMSAPGHRPKRLRKPDVRAGDLVKKKRRDHVS